MAEIKFTGNLGREPKIEFTPNGNAKLTFSVADTKGKKDDQGNWDKSQELTQWFRCTLWGPDAEYYAERLRQGARVTVFGDFMSRPWVDREGVNQTSLEVTVRGLNITNKKGSQQQAQQPAATADQGWGGQQNQGGWGDTAATGQGGWGNSSASTY